MRTPRIPVVVVALLACALLTSCVRMPHEGPVIVRDSSGSVESLPGLYFDPKPPQPGQTPDEIVAGFLEAMKAMPIRTSVAAQFLTEGAQASWDPEQATLTYADIGEPTGQVETRVPLLQVNHYNAGGAWERSRQRRTLRLELTTEDGEWRISEAPDALVVPESWFADWYRRVSLYFFDPTARILVPEPVFVPEGDEFASSLVQGLLPESEVSTSPVTRTAFPPGLDLALSVPITERGVAEVTLEGEGLEPGEPLDDLTVQRMLVQLAWTLRQEDRLRGLRLALGDQELPLPGGLSEVSLDIGAAYDPNGELATRDVFGLRDGRLVRGPVIDLQPTSGPFGQQRLGIRSVAVDLPGTTAAGISGDGGAVLVAPVDDPDGRAVEVLSGATDLLPPAWDHAGILWLLDRNAGSARVQVVVDQRRRTIAVPGVSGQDVKAFLVSRDGTRLVAVVHGRRSDRVVMSRILHDENGRVLRATRARRIGGPPDVEGPVRIRDIGWRSPTAVSVLSDITDDLSQVRTIAVDGAPGDLTTTGTSRVRGRARALVSSPVEGESAYVVTREGLTDLTVPERDLSDVEAALRTLTYVG